MAPVVLVSTSSYFKRNGPEAERQQILVRYSLYAVVSWRPRTSALTVT